jgi:hypothetical protein
MESSSAVKGLIDALEEIKNISRVMERDGTITMTQEGHIATKALTDWASAPKEGLRWVKASERLPDNPDKVHWRNDERLPISGGTADLEINRDNNLNIEWLDESSAPESGQKDNHEITD